MTSNGLALGPKLRYLAQRARRIDIGAVIERAKEVRQEHGKPVPTVLADMLWQAARKDVAFQDYVDFDFAILTPEERATFMTHPVSAQLAQQYSQPAGRRIFEDKIAFNERFSEFLNRVGWSSPTTTPTRCGNSSSRARSSPRFPVATWASACVVITPRTSRTGVFSTAG